MMKATINLRREGRLFPLLLCLALAFGPGCAGPSGQGTGDARDGVADTAEATAPTVDFSFVFIGCNRVGFSDNEHPSTANPPQLLQTLQDIHDLATTDPSLGGPPRFLFFVGDLVRNEEHDGGQTVESQLAAWQTLWNGGPLAGSATQLVPIAGNHEVLYSLQVGGSGPYFEIPDNFLAGGATDSYSVWLDWIQANGHDAHAGNGPTGQGANPDRLVGDDSKFTYSFQTPLASGKAVHFVLANTDTRSTFRASSGSSCLQDPSLIGDPLPGWIAADWIEKDIAAAQRDGNVELIFALGHKPVESRQGSRDALGRDTILNCDDGGASAPAPKLADQFLNTLQSNSKVAAYLTSHDHTWAHTTPGGVDQIIAGNGGSPPDPSAPYFGFTLVRVYTDGTTDAVSYGRPIPDPIDLAPTTCAGSPQDPNCCTEASCEAPCVKGAACAATQRQVVALG